MQSGFQSNLLQEQQENSYLFPGDIVFAKAFNKTFLLKVKRKVQLLNEDSVVDVDIVKDPSFDGLFTIKDLFYHQGLIFIVPSSLYEISDNCIIYNNVIAQSVKDVLIDMGERSVLTDEELALVSSINQNQNVEPAFTEEAGTFRIEIKEGFFYLVKLESKSGGPSKHYIVQNDSAKDIEGLHLMNFLKKDGVSDRFSWINCRDGLVALDE